MPPADASYIIPRTEVHMHGGGLELALVFLLAAVIAVPVFRRFGLGAVLGYLAAGVVLGPYGLRVIRNVEPVFAASEIGVVMLLFVIGLELSPSRLSVMRKPVFGAGGLQMLACGVALFVMATGMYDSLDRARNSYYDSARMADVAVSVVVAASVVAPSPGEVLLAHPAACAQSASAKKAANRRADRSITSVSPARLWRSAFGREPRGRNGGGD